MIIDGTFTDVTTDTVTNRVPTWCNDPYLPFKYCYTVSQTYARVASWSSWRPMFTFLGYCVACNR